MTDKDEMWCSSQTHCDRGDHFIQNCSFVMQTYLDPSFAISIHWIAMLNASRNLSHWTETGTKLILLKEELYLEGPEVHVFIVEVSTLCQFGKMAFGEGKSEKHR